MMTVETLGRLSKLQYQTFFIHSLHFFHLRGFASPFITLHRSCVADFAAHVFTIYIKVFAQTKEIINAVTQWDSFLVEEPKN